MSTGCAQPPPPPGRVMLAITFLLPIELAAPEVRPGLERAEKGARASGTPFISSTPTEMLTQIPTISLDDEVAVPQSEVGRRDRGLITYIVT